MNVKYILPKNSDFVRMHKREVENMYDSSEVAKRIKETATEKKITMKDLFSACNLSKNTLSNMKNGNFPSGDSLALIADKLECSVDYLLGRCDADVGTEVSFLSAKEKRLVSEYRKQPNRREAVDVLLGLDGSQEDNCGEKVHYLRTAAKDGNSEMDGKRKAAKSLYTDQGIEKIKNLEDIDDME